MISIGSRPSRVWPSAVLAALSTIPGEAHAQTTAPGRAPLSVTVTAAEDPPGRGMAPATLDPGVARVDGNYPSPQGGYEPPTKSLPMPPPPPPALPQGLSSQATMPVYPPGNPQGYSPPSGNFFLPPAQPYGAMPPAMPYGYMPPAMPYGYMPAAQPYGFMPPAAPYGYMPPAMPYGYSPAPAMPFGYSPPPAVPFAAAPALPAAVPFASSAPVAAGLNAITNQSVSVPTSRSTNRVRVRGPGLVGSSLARVGERLTQFGKTRIETTQETELDTPLSQPSGGVATISSTSSTPLIQQQNSVTYPSAQPQGAPVAPQPQPQPQPQVPMASPQGEQRTHKHHWWN